MTTTIAISEAVREKIKSFGSKGESYNEIILKLYNSAVERQLHDILMDTANTVPVRDALERAKRRWQ